VDFNRAWETIREIIKISAKESVGYYELKKHKPWFDEDAQIVRPKEKSQIAVITGFKRKKRG
jgi:hypothetical protein